MQLRDHLRITLNIATQYETVKEYYTFIMVFNTAFLEMTRKHVQNTNLYVSI